MAQVAALGRATRTRRASARHYDLYEGPPLHRITCLAAALHSLDHLPSFAADAPELWTSGNLWQLRRTLLAVQQQLAAVARVNNALLSTLPWTDDDKAKPLSQKPAAVRARRRRRGETKPPVSADEQQRRDDKRRMRRRLAEANRRQVRLVLETLAKTQALERATIERAKLPHLPTLTPRTPRPTQDDAP